MTTLQQILYTKDDENTPQYVEEWMFESIKKWLKQDLPSESNAHVRVYIKKKIAELEETGEKRP